MEWLSWKMVDFTKTISRIQGIVKNKLHPKVYMILSEVLRYMKKQWFFIGLACFIALAHSYPNAVKDIEINYWAVAVIFFVSGLSMKTKDLMKNMGHWRAHCTVLTSSFLITSSIIFGICCGIKKAGNPKIDNWMLVGLIVTGTCPTTVASNVVMTKQADANELLSLCEVFIGNVLGAFITPALSQLFLAGTWAFSNPANDANVGRVYKDVMKQIGLSVFVPLFAGQVLQNVFFKQVTWCLTTFKLNKLGTFMLLLVMWSSFSTAFRQDAFTSVSKESIIMIVFFNIAIYLFFTILCFFYARPYFLLKIFQDAPNENSSRFYSWSYTIFRPFYYDRRDTVSIMLCGPAKTAALGVSLVTSQYGSNNENLGKLLVPLVLYQAEQVFCAGILTTYFKKWIHADPNFVIENKLAQATEDYEMNIESSSIDLKAKEYLMNRTSDDPTNSSVNIKNLK